MALTGSYPIIVAGSTHPNEESMLLVSFAQILAKFPEAKLVIAPRKPGRVQEITHLAQKFGYSVGFRKELLTQPAAERLASQTIFN